jgi:hypothetical protein
MKNEDYNYRGGFFEHEQLENLKSKRIGGICG